MTTQPLSSRLRFRCFLREPDGLLLAATQVWLTDDEVVLVRIPHMVWLPYVGALALLAGLLVVLGVDVERSIAILAITALLGFIVGTLTSSRTLRDLERATSGRLAESPTVAGRLEWAGLHRVEERSVVVESDTPPFVFFVLHAREGQYFDEKRSLNVVAVSDRDEAALRAYLHDRIGRGRFA